MDTLRYRDFEELKRDIWLVLKREGANADTHVRALLQKYGVPDTVHQDVWKKSLDSYNVVINTKHHSVGGSRFSQWREKVQFSKYLEALSYLRPVNDPILDSKMRQSFEIKDFELKFGLVSGLAASAIIAVLPGWKGKPLALRLAAASGPLLFNYYRGFRRGYDTIEYVGNVWLEYHLRKRSLIQNLNEREDIMPELKEYLQETGKLDKLTQEYA